MLGIVYSDVKRKIKRIAVRYEHLTFPKHIKARFTQIGQPGLHAIKCLLEEEFFARFPEGYLSTDHGQRDLMDHLTGRLDGDRHAVIPWLDSARALQGCQILEIGCGTGCSTVALAEQGARVVGVDFDEPALRVAKKRCEIHGLDVQFYLANATEVNKLLSGRRFDWVIFYASLEHMVHQERLTAIRSTWDMLSPNDFLCVVDTPNRLWYYDSHTSRLPFFSWLPDELALEYARFSSRKGFRELAADEREETRLSFLRWGRGASFHEFHLAIGRPVEQLKVVSSLDTHRKHRSIFRQFHRRPSLERRFHGLLSAMHPGLHPAWFQPSLDLIIQK